MLVSAVFTAVSSDNAFGVDHLRIRILIVLPPSTAVAMEGGATLTRYPVRLQ